MFKSVTNGVIAKEKSGTYEWAWDFIFIPDGYDKAMNNKVELLKNSESKV